MNLILVKASKEYESQIMEMLFEWNSKISGKDDDDATPWSIFRDYKSYDEFMKMLIDDEDITKLKEGLVPSSTYFLYNKEHDKILGACNIRHYLNERLRNGGGHIGDGVRPSCRGKGYGKEIVRLALEECKKLGIKEVLMSCNPDNIASKKTITSNGGCMNALY